MTEFTVAVTDLARFCHRGGDIDHRFSPSPSSAEGIAGHQRLYARRADSYRSEYPLQYRHEADGVRLLLRGRADGYDPDAGLVEEIKTCRVPADAIPAAVADLHLAQGTLYAAIIAQQEGVGALRVRVTWLNIDTDSEHCLERDYDSAELAQFLQHSLQRFSAWLQRLAALRQARDDSLARLDFPLGDFRRGQRNIAELAYKCVHQGGQLLVEAPTGIGKTAAVLYPALKALGTGVHERVLFVTARTVGRRAAEDTLAQFRRAGYCGTALSLTAKDSICLSPGRACHGEDCPYARGYYERLPAALEAALQRPALRRAELEALAQQFEVCPYELARDLLPWVDTVIADLHYVYSLGASLPGDGDGRRSSVLLDEAHNLPGRARKLYSARLGKRALLQARRNAPPPLAAALTRINRRLLALQKQDWDEADFHSSPELPQGLLHALADFAALTAEQLGRDPTLLPRDPDLLQLYFDILQFLRVAQEWGPEYRCQLQRGAGPQSLVVSLNCLDPARLLAQRQERAHAVIAFSATLSPLAWTRRGLGLGQDTVCLRTESPFAARQLQVSLATGLDTRFARREHTLPDLADLLQRWLQDTPGNCIIYFPSYRYLQDCTDLLPPLADRALWLQAREEGEARRAELLQLLATRRDVAAFCILGGIFGEGIDLPGEQLASVVVVGVGMPQVNRDTRELQAWYEGETGRGFEFTFLYPGMQKVDQALGRVVRSPTDQGSALLVDPRYGRREYRDLLPPWWEYREWPRV
ncbi:MAG: ATP-dependent DNA helicase [Halioglobus sp.]|nr:ATP-dependent DNA helicase [Halioglobus sp.]